MWYMYTMECYSVIEKKNNTICNNIDGAGDDDIKWSKSDRETQIWWDITYMQNLKKVIQMNLFYKAETDS